MVTDLFYLLIIIVVFVLGLSRPHIALAGLIWVNLFKPQTMSYSFLAGKPLSAVMTVFALIVFAFNYKKLTKPCSGWYLFLIPLFITWITLTTFQAEFQQAAWFKYDVAIKTIIVSYLIPFVLTERKHIELVLWVIIGSFSYFAFSAGVKSALGYGGYGVDLVSLGKESILAEGSTLATYAISMIPLLLFLTNTDIALNKRALFWGARGLVVICLFVLVGTQARTGFVVLCILFFLGIIHSNAKKKIIGLGVVLCVVSISFLSGAWLDRISTVAESSSEASAHGRVLVWRWTIDYANERPIFGGGFNSYLANVNELGSYGKVGEVTVPNDRAKAFHSVVFEVLGEHGYVGLFLYAALCLHGLFVLRKLFKDDEAPDWLRSCALALYLSMCCYLVGGLFIAIAFYPMHYQLYALAISLHKIRERDEQCII